MKPSQSCPHNAQPTHNITTYTRAFFSLILTIALIFCFIPATGAITRAYAEEACVTNTEIEATSSSELEAVGIIAIVEEGVSTLSTDSANTALIDEVTNDFKDLGLSVTDIFTLNDGTSFISAEPTNGTTTEEALELATAVSGVVSVQLDYSYALIDTVDDTNMSNTVDPAPLIDLLVSLAPTLSFRPFDDPIALVSSSTSSPNAYWLYTTNLTQAWEAAVISNPVTIAVFDTGIEFDHEDLSEAILTDLAWDSYNDTPLSATNGSSGDNNGHGTHVAGIAAAIPNNNIGIAGASYGASIVPVKVVNNTSNPMATTSSVVRAYTYIFSLIDAGLVENLRVVNLSLGSYSEAFNDTLLSETIETARNDYGIVTVCAGGNGDSNGVAQTNTIYPADFEACVSVTSLSADGTNSSWSDYNEYKDISAPGEGIWSTYPTGLSGTSSPYHRLTGTSMATPIVAGAFALLFAIDPELTVSEACEILYASADDIIDNEYDRSSISGSHGALNVAAAVEHLTGLDLSAGNFPDVADDAWYTLAVIYVAQRGIMTGYDENAEDLTGYFDPEKALTRAEAAQLLYNIYGNGALASATNKPDVNQNAWYATAVNWVIEAQLMNGYDDGSNLFDPDAPLTREQFAIIINNASSVDTIADPDKITTLPDSDTVSSWATDAVIWAVGNGVLNGAETLSGERVLLPQASITRAMVAQALMNTYEAGLL